MRHPAHCGAADACLAIEARCFTEDGLGGNFKYVDDLFIGAPA